MSRARTDVASKLGFLLLWNTLAFAPIALAQQAAQEARFISGTVYWVDNSQPIARAEIHIDGAGSNTASDSGEFRFPLRPPLRVGFPATFSVRNWEIVDPCNLRRGRTYLPDPDAESIRLTVLAPGDRRLLTGASAECVVIERASRFEVGMESPSRYSAALKDSGQPAYSRLPLAGQSTSLLTADSLGSTCAKYASRQRRYGLKKTGRGSGIQH